MTDSMGFEQVCEEAKKLAFSFKNPLIVHHFDCDGLSAGAIVISAFRTEFKTHRHIWIKKLDDSTFNQLEKEKEIIFVDLGSGNERVNELKDVLIIDHHQPKEINKFQVNPLLFGIDGGTELSSSGTAYYVFKNHVDLAIVGAIGDMQYPLIGKNREILKEGIKSRVVGLDNDLRLYGRSSRPLPQFLAYSDETYIPGITYKEENAIKFLEDLGIELKKGEVWRNYIDLSEEEKNKLRKSLITFLVDNGYEERAKQLIGEIYLLKKRPIRSDLYDVSEFSTILNACGRHGKADVGIGVCLGEEEAYKEALTLLKHHKTMIREGILYARAHIQNLGSILFLDGREIIDEGIIGIVCGMISPPFSKKPILGISSSSDGTIKVSTRASSTLVNDGVNLGKILSISAGKVGGIGGGHKMAAGATVLSCRLEEFLVEFSKELSQKTK